MYLHPSDSFISFRLTPVFVSTGGTASLSLDANAYSVFRNARVRHGSNVLVNQRNCNRLWNALFDIQVGASDREARQIDLGIEGGVTTSNVSNLYGTGLISGQAISCSFTLPMAVVGSLQEKAIPLGWLNTSQLFIELDVEDMARMFTTRISNNVVTGASGTVTALTLTSVTLSDVMYHAKVSQNGPQFDDLLLSSLGEQIAIPATEWAGDEKYFGGGTSINENFSFPFSSCNSFLWWATTNSTATGSIITNNLTSAISQRNAGGDLKEYNLSLNGQNYPPTPIICDMNGAVNSRTGINGSVCLQHLFRCFNLNSSSNAGGVLNYTIYSNATASRAGDATTKRFVAGISLDRGDGENQRYYQGTNTVNQTVALRAIYNTGPVDPQTIYAFMMHDIAFVIQDGLMSAQK